MAYCTANDQVLNLTGFTTSYSTATQPTDSQVSSIIGMVDGEINSALAGIGITTVTNSNLLSLCSKISAMGSAGLVLQRYGKADNDYRLADWFYTKFQEWIEKIITDEKYKMSLSKMQAGSLSGVFVGNQVADGTISETSIKYLDEEFKA